MCRTVGATRSRNTSTFNWTFFPLTPHITYTYTSRDASARTEDESLHASWKIQSSHQFHRVSVAFCASKQELRNSQLSSVTHNIVEREKLSEKRKSGRKWGKERERNQIVVDIHCNHEDDFDNVSLIFWEELSFCKYHQQCRDCARFPFYFIFRRRVLNAGNS